MVCFLKKSRAYDYRDPSILTLPKYNTNTHGKKCFMYEGAKLWISIGNGIKTIENNSEFKTLLKKWNGSPGMCKNCNICTINYMCLKVWNYDWGVNICLLKYKKYNHTMAIYILHNRKGKIR